MTRSTLNALCASLLCLAATGAVLVGAPSDASAFCGFYVSGGDASLFNDATQVALMRKGTRTVLSMQNNYKGPVKDFAMVIPVPVVLMEEQVKTLPRDLFDKLDKLSAPRLVEYWEQDPCYEPPDYYAQDMATSSDSGAFSPDEDMGGQEPPPVVVEAEFAVGEYDIVLLSATEGSALESWLGDNNYNIPAGATPLFNQYIQNDMYFFVAKINPAKATFSEGEAVLSPLRFAFDSPTFNLPIRLGMVNSSGEQDLIVYVLSQDGRYELANYDNVTIPTNKIVSQDTRTSFGEFYSLLFADTLAKNPGSVVTEYAWGSSSCDPCPGPVLDVADLTTLGADEFGVVEEWGPLSTGWFITRLHARYGTEGLDEDLIFQKAPDISGGNGVPGPGGELDESVQAGNFFGSQFQGRYVMLNPWDGEIACENPNRGLWGYSNSAVGSAVSPNSGGQSKPPEDRELGSFFADPFNPGGGGSGGSGSGGGDNGSGSGDNGSGDGNGQSGSDEGEVGGSGCSTTSSGGPLSGLLALLGLSFGLGLRRRRKR